MLRASGADLDLYELLDVLWLARALPPGVDLPLSRHSPTGDRAVTGPDDGTAKDGADPSSESTTGPGRDRPPARRLFTGVAAGTGRSGTRETSLPEPRALPDARILARALRPLNRRRTVPGGGELDESATATRWAETGLPELVLRPGREPWLRCVLVVDDGVPMLIWRKLVAELDVLLGRLGGFRQVTVVGLRNRGPGPVRLRARPFGADGPDRSPATIVDTTGRTLVLVVTDGAGAAWRDGRMRAVLDGWGRRGPTAVLHTLPRRMWPGSGVAGDPYPVSGSGAGVPNSVWQLPPWASQGLRSGVDTRVPLPVLELSPSSLQPWAGLVATGGTTRLTLWEDGPTPAATAQPVLAERELETFLRSASPPARRLAAYIAHLAPLSVPAMRLVGLTAPATTGRPGPGSVELAEVLLGGLLRPVPHPTRAWDEQPFQHRQFDLLAETKEQLAELVPTAELRALRREVTGRLEQLAGAAPDFPAWMSTDSPGPEGRGELALARGRLLSRLEPTAPAAPSTETTSTSPAEPPAMAPPPPVPSFSGHRQDDHERPYFFLSYAHVPRARTHGAGDPNHWVSQLYEDLCEAVLALTSYRSGLPVGFMDQSMHQGELWAGRISQELATCRVFVPLYSPRYFSSLACGQEWHSFTQRPVFPARQTSERTSGIVPVLWVPMSDRQLPEVARQLQFNHRVFGREYEDEGLYALMKLGYFRKAYELAVFRLARRIVEVAENTVIPTAQPVDFTAQPSAFTTPRARAVRISVIARDHHGAPFPSTSDRTLAEHAARVARQLGFEPTVHEFEEELVATASGPPEAPTVVLVDRRTAQDGDRSEQVARLDRSRPPWTSVVTVSGQHEFEEELPRALMRARHGFESRSDQLP
ncbi:TIR-like protein FxsC [Kitasatospora sp. NPDC001664]